MEKIYEKQAYELTKQDYLDGRTLICLYHWKKDDKHVGAGSMPHDADFELCFMLCNHKTLRFFLGEKEYHDLLTDDVQRINIHSALRAEKNTVENIRHKYGQFEQKRIDTYLESLEQIVNKNTAETEKVFGGDGK